MEVSDDYLKVNQDWDPSYLEELLCEDFFDFTNLWESNIQDCELLKEMDRVERYSPITEDISLDDEKLCTAVEKIEHE